MEEGTEKFRNWLERSQFLCDCPRGPRFLAVLLFLLCCVQTGNPRQILSRNSSHWVPGVCVQSSHTTHRAQAGWESWIDQSPTPHTVCDYLGDSILWKYRVRCYSDPSFTEKGPQAGTLVNEQS